MKWATSDSHFGHGNVIKYCNRPFESTEEMDEVMVSNWNSVVSPKDEVYHLGDLIFANKKRAKEDTYNLAKRLNGKIHWVWGNHDKYTKGADGFSWQGDYLEVKYEKQLFVLSHYSFVSWNKRFHKSIHLHGHSHGTLKDDGEELRFDVGVDVWDFKPVSFDKIINLAEARKKSNLEKFGVEIVSIDHH